MKKESFELKSTMQDNPLATWKFTQITLVAKNAMHTTYPLNVRVQKISLKSSTANYIAGHFKRQVFAINCCNCLFHRYTKVRRETLQTVPLNCKIRGSLDSFSAEVMMYGRTYGIV